MSYNFGEQRLGRIESQQMEILEAIRQIPHMEKRIMAAIDDLKAADAAETAELAVVAQALTDEITRVDAALATLGNSDDPDVAAVAADIQTHVTNLQTIATSLAGVAQPSTPAPTPSDPNAPTS